MPVSFAIALLALPFLVQGLNCTSSISSCSVSTTPCACFGPVLQCVKAAAIADKTYNATEFAQTCLATAAAYSCSAKTLCNASSDIISSASGDCNTDFSTCSGTAKCTCVASALECEKEKEIAQKVYDAATFATLCRSTASAFSCSSMSLCGVQSDSAASSSCSTDTMACSALTGTAKCACVGSALTCLQQTGQIDASSFVQVCKNIASANGCSSSSLCGVASSELASSASGCSTDTMTCSSMTGTAKCSCVGTALECLKNGGTIDSTAYAQVCVNMATSYGCSTSSLCGIASSTISTSSSCNYDPMECASLSGASKCTCVGSSLDCLKSTGQIDATQFTQLCKTTASAYGCSSASLCGVASSDITSSSSCSTDAMTCSALTGAAKCVCVDTSLACLKQSGTVDAAAFAQVCRNTVTAFGCTSSSLCGVISSDSTSNSGCSTDTSTCSAMTGTSKCTCVESALDCLEKSGQVDSKSFPQVCKNIASASGCSASSICGVSSASYTSSASKSCSADILTCASKGTAKCSCIASAMQCIKDTAIATGSYDAVKFAKTCQDAATSYSCPSSICSAATSDSKKATSSSAIGTHSSTTHKGSSFTGVASSLHSLALGVILIPAFVLSL